MDQPGGWSGRYGPPDRALNRAGLRFFQLRVALRVPEGESFALLGVPAAARLDNDRAYYRDADWPAERVEKFKPYALASLAAVLARAFTNRRRA